MLLYRLYFKISKDPIDKIKEKIEKRNIQMNQELGVEKLEAIDLWDRTTFPLDSTTPIWSL